MKLVKISLVAAVAVASLSTASFADGMMSGAKISGKTDFRWTSSSTGDASTNKSTRERVDVHVKSASKDGMGKVHFAIRSEMGELGTLAAYADYKLGSVTVGAGPKIGFPGNFSYGFVRGLTVSTKVAGFTVGAGVADADTGMQENEKSIITAKGKVAGMADLKFDYRLGADKMGYLATDVTVKAGPATIVGAYAAGQGDGNKDVSIMGADVSVGLGSITAYGAFSMSGKMGGMVTEKGVKGLTGNAMGGIPGGNKAGEVTAMKFGAKTKVAGIAVGGYYAMATPDGGDTSSRIYVDASKKLNAQSSVKAMYYMDSTGVEGDDDSKNTIELRFSSKL